MHRAFQTSMTLFRPQLVIFLGDLFDEGKWVTDEEFDVYVQRFYTLFHTPDDVQVIAAVGNHDIGFHYATRPGIFRRFERQFGTTGVKLVTVHGGVHFVSINSVAMQGDGCELCDKAQRELRNISSKWWTMETVNLIYGCCFITGTLKCSRGIGKACDNVEKLAQYSPPIVLQHYPMYRESDEACEEHDSLRIEPFRETWEVLSQESTDLIGELLEPRLAFSGHSHDFCRLKNRLNIEEWTIPSFSWRNRDNPAFALATITEKDYSVGMCQLPRESTLWLIYGIGGLLALLNSFRWLRKIKRRGQAATGQFKLK